MNNALAVGVVDEAGVGCALGTDGERFIASSLAASVRGVKASIAELEFYRKQFRV